MEVIVQKWIWIEFEIIAETNRNGKQNAQHGDFDASRSRGNAEDPSWLLGSVQKCAFLSKHHQ